MSNISDDSKKNPTDFRQDRRSWLKTSATAIGASFLTLPAATIAGAQDAPPPAAKEAKAAAVAAEKPTGIGARKVPSPFPRKIKAGVGKPGPTDAMSKFPSLLKSPSATNGDT